jgi:rRNA maturation endonuclease Nob1
VKTYEATEQAYKNGYEQGKKDALKKVVIRRRAKLYWKLVAPGEWNLTCSACDSHLGCKETASFCPECGARFVRPKAVMPEPPKE